MLPEDRLSMFYELTKELEKEKYIIDVKKKTSKNGDITYNYVMKNDEDTTVSKLSCFVYDSVKQKKFDWILMANVKTLPSIEEWDYLQNLSNKCVRI